MASAALAQAVDRQPSVAARQATRCIEAAAQYHRVNASVLRAILQVESALNPHALHRNADGSWDIGIGQINTIHLKELSQWHLTPAHLLDACIGTYVAAWHLSRQMSRHGNTWKAVGAYHSETERFNRRYQSLVYGELQKAGGLTGSPLRSEPELHPANRPTRGMDAPRSEQEVGGLISLSGP